MGEMRGGFLKKIIFLLMLLTMPSFGALVIKQETAPIIKDNTIRVITYYDDVNYDGFHTFVYSTRDKTNFFFTAWSDFYTVDATHQFAVVWITNRIIEIMIANCCNETNTSSSPVACVNNRRFELYDIGEDEDEIYEEEEKKSSTVSSSLTN